MLLALRQNNLLGKIKFVGFDTSPPLVEGLRRGEIHALMAQNPKKIGYEGVKIIVAYLHGEQVLRSVDTGVVLVTQENLNSPEIQKLLGL
jgi:ribose transport system substrate-binding protein